MITSRKEPSVDLTILIGEGVIAAADVIRAMEAMYADNPTRLVLWDFTDADVAGMAFDEVQEIALLAVEHSQRRPGGKTSIITAQQIAFGITRVYESLAERTVVPLQVHVCWTLPEALEFLGLKELPGV